MSKNSDSDPCISRSWDAACPPAGGRRRNPPLPPADASGRRPPRRAAAHHPPLLPPPAHLLCTLSDKHASNSICKNVHLSVLEGGKRESRYRTPSGGTKRKIRSVIMTTHGASCVGMEHDKCYWCITNTLKHFGQTACS